MSQKAWAVLASMAASTAAAQVTESFDFNSGVDMLGNASGQLEFVTSDGVSITFDNDGSGDGVNGVEITNSNWGNRFAGSDNLVLGSGDFFRSSGIVITFSTGVESVSILDADDDHTEKALFAFDQMGELIGQTAFGTQTTFALDTLATGGQRIWSVEFDTAPGTAGGINDGTYFTIDDLVVTTPTPGSATLLLGAAAAMSRRRRA